MGIVYKSKLAIPSVLPSHNWLYYEKAKISSSSIIMTSYGPDRPSIYRAMDVPAALTPETIQPERKLPNYHNNQGRWHERGCMVQINWHATQGFDVLWHLYWNNRNWIIVFKRCVCFVMSRLPQCKVNKMRPSHISRHFAYDIFKCISWMKIYEFRLRFHFNIFLRFELRILQHWFS